MASNKGEFYDLGSGRSQSDILPGSNRKSKKGCWVGVGGAIGIALAAAIVAMIVGLCVFYLHPDRKSKEEIDVTTTTTTTAATSTTAAPIDYFLPADLVPTHYIAKLRPNFYEGDRADYNFNGSVKIFFTVINPTKKIILHHKQLEVDADHIEVLHVHARRRHGLEIDGAPTYDSIREFYTISLVTELTAGETYSVYMEFTGPLKDDLKGIYLSQYTNDNGANITIVTSHTQPTEARKVFPCFDEPALKASFAITLERKKYMTTFANAGIKNTTELTDNWVADEYVDTPPMSTYILAFMVSQFECVNTTTKNNATVYVCARPEYKDQTQHAISIAGEMQEFYEEYHEIKYPLPITVHMAVPDFSAGAMENWGLIFYRETALLFDEKTSAAYNKQRVTIVVAHELAHMWFGNLVTPGWWDDIWLNEGFASYMEIICTDNSFPDWDMDGQLVTDDLQSVMTIDSLVSSHPIYQPVYDPAQINELFDSITYSKGASIIRMMRYFMGDETFRKGISRYLDSRKYEAAHHLDLFRTLTEQPSEDGLEQVNITEIMQTWILQMGYPVVHLSYTKQSGEVSISQKHFKLNPSEQAPASPYNYEWIVPISVVTSMEKNFDNPHRVWLRKTSDVTSVAAGAEWILGNSKERYYYRVNYDVAMWNAITAQLLTDHQQIDSNNRAQLIDDSFSLGRSGDIDITVSLEVSKYLTDETEYVPWRTFYRNIDYMNRMLQTSQDYNYLQSYVGKQVQPIYDQIGWSDNSTSDPHLEQRNRVITLDLACSYGMTDCLQNAAGLFQQWMNAADPSTSNPISQNLRSVTYCSAVRGGGRAEWDFTWSRYRTAPSSSEASTLLYALTCTGDMNILSELLDRALRLDGIRLQDFRTVVTNIASNPAGRSLAWNFMRQNWNQLLVWFGEVSFTLPSLVSGVTKSFSSEWELQELETFVTVTPELATSERAFEQAIENTRTNKAWRDANEDNIISWLKQQTMP